MTNREVPTIGLMTPTEEARCPHLRTVPLDVDAMYRDGVQALIDRGCRRLAVLVACNARRHQLPCFIAEVERRGLEYRPMWAHGIPLKFQQWTRHALDVLMGLPPDDRPDGLFIADDHLVATAAAELADSGYDKQLHVVGQANFPLAELTPEIHRVGYNNHDLLLQCIEKLDATRRKR